MPQRRVITGRSQEPRQRFAEELRTLRAGSGTSLRALGERLGWDWSLFGKMEKGETLGSPEVVQALDTHYGTPGLLLAMAERGYVTVHVLLQSSGVHGLVGTDVWFLRLADGRPHQPGPALLPRLAGEAAARISSSQAGPAPSSPP
ncbi:hypothetical protein GCM10010381_41030 [Streptomyces xantholiticus]|nr:hypothetical protein GCM10010381_41030 [Streptomyces xantholiticus]